MYEKNYNLILKQNVNCSIIQTTQYYTDNTLIWKSNSLSFSQERYCLVENIVKLENENHHGVAIAIM